MNAKEMLENIGELLRSTATVQSVCGEPIRTEGKTVAPVAKVAYGFSAGSGSRPGNHGTEGHRQAEGGGGGGGVARRSDRDSCSRRAVCLAASRCTGGAGGRPVVRPGQKIDISD
jgi:hypothetical protein